MRNPYQVSNEIEYVLLIHADEETGEISQEGEGLLNDLQVERDDIIEDLIASYKNALAEAEMLSTVNDDIVCRMEKAQNRADSIKKIVAKTLNGEKYSCVAGACSWRTSTSTNIDHVDISALPDDCIIVKKMPSKDAIKKALLGGVEIAGAFIEKKQSMSIK